MRCPLLAAGPLPQFTRDTRDSSEAPPGNAIGARFCLLTTARVPADSLHVPLRDVQAVGARPELGALLHRPVPERLDRYLEEMMTSIVSVGILSPGEMGAAVAWVLRRHGLQVFPCLDGRGDWTVSRAREAEIEGLPNYDELVREADILLSIVAPSQARVVADQVAKALQRTETTLTYVDCNAVSPQPAREVARTVTEAGAQFVDAAIIGGPPTVEEGPRFYASGPDLRPFEALSEHGLDVHVMGQGVDQASGFKMIYGATTKGVGALWLELMVAAEAMGLRGALEAELARGDGLSRKRVERFMTVMAPRSARYVGEMEEIAATFEGVGLTPRMLLGAADMFALAAKTPLAGYPGGHRHELDHVLEVLARAVEAPSANPLSH